VGPVRRVDDADRRGRRAERDRCPHPRARDRRARRLVALHALENSGERGDRSLCVVTLAERTPLEAQEAHLFRAARARGHVNEKARHLRRPVGQLAVDVSLEIRFETAPAHDCFPWYFESRSRSFSRPRKISIFTFASDHRMAFAISSYARPWSTRSNS